MEKRRLSNKRYREANRDKLKAKAAVRRAQEGMVPRVKMTDEERLTRRKAKKREYDKKRRPRNAVVRRAYYLANREKYLVYSRKYRKAHDKEYLNQKQADYQREKKKDPAYLEAYNAKMKEYQRRYRAEAKAKKDN